MSHGPGEDEKTAVRDQASAFDDLEGLKDITRHLMIQCTQTAEKLRLLLEKIQQAEDGQYMQPDH